MEKEEETDQKTTNSDGDTNPSFENDDGSLQSFGSITRILRKDKRTLRRTNTCFESLEKKSRNEMMLALFLYTFECISVTVFSAIMYQFYHFEKYRGDVGEGENQEGHTELDDHRYEEQAWEVDEADHVDRKLGDDEEDPGDQLKECAGGKKSPAKDGMSLIFLF